MFANHKPGGDMATKRVKLTFPQDLIKEPVVFNMAKKYDVMPNIRRAKVTESVGEVVLELEGADKNLEAGIAYLKERVKVKPWKAISLIRRHLRTQRRESADRGS
jgi:ABC-type methionine transport system ATPase subunit